MAAAEVAWLLRRKKRESGGVFPDVRAWAIRRRTHFGLRLFFDLAECQRTGPALFWTVPGGGLRVDVGRWFRQRRLNGLGRIWFRS